MMYLRRPDAGVAPLQMLLPSVLTTFNGKRIRIGLNNSDRVITRTAGHRPPPHRANAFWAAIESTKAANMRTFMEYGQNQRYLH